MSELRKGDVLTDQEITERFRCGLRRGIRYSVDSQGRIRHVVVITSDRKGVVFRDAWKGDELHYVGEGLKDNQSLDTGGNRALALQSKQKFPLHVFWRRDKNEYEYRGRFRVSGEPYRRREPGSDGRDREVYVFVFKPNNR